MTAWESLEDQLVELNEIATRTLVAGEPEPDGLPPAGSWIRAYRMDVDLQAIPASPWHYVIGWDRHIGVLSTRCRRRPGWVVRAALGRYIRESGDWWRRERLQLSVSHDEPGEDACRQCLAGLARDLECEAAAERERERAAFLELLPALQRIADDPALDDAACGREFRALWLHVDGG